MKFNWSHLLQVLFANAVPLLQKAVNKERVTSEDYTSAAINSFLGYVAISGSLPAVQAQGNKVETTIKLLGEVAPFSTDTPPPSMVPTSSGLS